MDKPSSSNSQSPSLQGSNAHLESSPEPTTQILSAGTPENKECVEESEPCISSSNSKIEPRVQSSQQQHQSRTFLRVPELDAGEIDKLFEILTETESAAYRGFLSHEREPMLRFSPYPVHQQLFLQQQQEQERRRQSLSTAASSRYSFPRTFHHDYRCRHTRFMFSDKCRSHSVRRVISFIDTLTARKTSTENDCTEKCVICMSHYKVDEELRELRCSHKFHRKCIDEWLVKSSLCPVCRTDLTGTGKAAQLWEEYGSAAIRGLDFEQILDGQNPVFESNRSSVSPLHNETKD